jgi:hypothetical protein
MHMVSLQTAFSLANICYMKNQIATEVPINGGAAAACPLDALQAVPAALAPLDELVFPMHKRVFTQFSTDLSGAPELHLYYGDKEISFDEPELFAFGQTLAKQSRFLAGAATAWGEGYEWEKVRELLAQLLDEGILEYASADNAEPPRLSGPGAQQAPTSADGARASLLPPALTTVARSWDDCAAITQELTGQRLDPAYLELVVPIFRVAHMALDAEGRQVGEANVFPKALRLDVPTSWRACIYSGSRYQDERPMNVTALKSMRAYWGQIMATLLHIREAYLLRFPAARAGMTLGDLERLSTLVLALPTYQLMRAQERVENGALHPVLSSMFRVTDGLRMTVHQMLFLPVGEATLAPDTPMSGSEIYAYAERNFAFTSSHGVCAGPQAMIEEFLSVIIDGTAPRHAEPVELDDAVQVALASIQQAFDYGLRGLQAFAVAFSLWPLMTRTYTHLADIAEHWAGPPSAQLATLRLQLQGWMAILQNETMHASEAWRVNREVVYADIYAQCALGLGQPTGRTLPELFTPVPGAEDAALAGQLRTHLQRQLPGAGDAHDRAIEGLLNCLMQYFSRTQAVLRVACDVQARINTLLGRAAPAVPFNANDVDIHVGLRGDEVRRLPYLLKELEALLGFSAAITRDSIEITDAANGACVASAKG